MQDSESTVDDPQQPKQSFYGGQNITYNGLQGSHLSPSATAHHSSSHNVNPTTRAQQLYAAAINASLGTSPPLSPRSSINSGSLPATPTTSLSLSPTVPYTSPGTQIMSGMYQPRPSSPTSQIYYHQHQRGSSSSLPSEATRDSFQGPIAMDDNAGLQQSAVYTQSFPRLQHAAQTATSNVDTLENSSTGSSASFYAGLNLGSQISVASLPGQQSHDSLTDGHAAHKTKVLSAKLGKVSKTIAKLALRVAGSAVQITTGVHVPTEAIVGFMDVVANLINRFASHEKNSPAISRDDLEAVFQGAPNAKYEEVIQALAMAQAQQQKAPGIAPAFNIRVLVDELGRLQALANARQVHVFQSQAYPSFGQMGAMGQSGSMGSALMNNVQPMQQTQLNALSAHTPGALTISEPPVYAPGPGIEPNPPHIPQTPASPSQFHLRSSLIDPSTSFPMPYQMHAASGARLYGDISGATNRLRSDDRDVSDGRDARSTRLPPEFMQQQAQLQTTLLQQQQQMTLLQQQQQQLVQMLLEQQQKHKQEIREERTSTADFSSKASVGSRSDSVNEVTSLPLPLI